MSARLATLLVLPLLALPGCIMWPSHAPVATDAHRRTLDADGRTLQLFERHLGPPSSPTLVVLVLPGSGGRAEHILDASVGLLAAGPDQPARVVALQHPGFGDDHGPAGLRHSGRAALAATRWLRARHPDATLWIHGASLGTVFALDAARQLPDLVDGLILEKPPDLRPLLLWRHGWWNLWLLAGPYACWLPREAQSARNAAAIGDVPALVILAEDDWIVPRDNALRVYRALSGPRALLTADTHHNGWVDADNTPLLGAALRWLAPQSPRVAADHEPRRANHK